MTREEIINIKVTAITPTEVSYTITRSYENGPLNQSTSSNTNTTSTGTSDDQEDDGNEVEDKSVEDGNEDEKDEAPYLYASNMDDVERILAAGKKRFRPDTYVRMDKDLIITLFESYKRAHCNSHSSIDELLQYVK